MITFTKTKLPYGWLGNMSAHNILYNNKEWKTAEALFQAMRFEDEAIIEEIRSMKSPMGTKMVARKHLNKMIITPRSPLDLCNMVDVLSLKVKQHPDLKKELLNTGDEQIVEDCTKRGMSESNCFWGMVLKDGQWIGENVLGKLWDIVRKDCRTAESSLNVVP